MSTTNNNIILVDKKEKKPPKFEGEKRQPRKSKLQGLPTEEQKWRTYKNYTEPALTLKHEMKEEEDETLTKLKELMGVKKDPINFSDVITQGTDNVLLRNSVFNQEQKTLKEEIEKANYIKQQQEDATRNILQKLGNARRKRSASSKLQAVVRAKQQNTLYNDERIQEDAVSKLQSVIRAKKATADTKVSLEVKRNTDRKIANGIDTKITPGVARKQAQDILKTLGENRKIKETKEAMKLVSKQAAKDGLDMMEYKSASKLQQAFKSYNAKTKLTDLKIKNQAASTLKKYTQRKVLLNKKTKLDGTLDERHFNGGKSLPNKSDKYLETSLSKTSKIKKSRKK